MSVEREKRPEAMQERHTNNTHRHLELESRRAWALVNLRGMVGVVDTQFTFLTFFDKDLFFSRSYNQIQYKRQIITYLGCFYHRSLPLSKFAALLPLIRGE